MPNHLIHSEIIVIIKKDLLYVQGDLIVCAIAAYMYVKKNLNNMELYPGAWMDQS